MLKSYPVEIQENVIVEILGGGEYLLGLTHGHTEVNCRSEASV